MKSQNFLRSCAEANPTWAFHLENPQSEHLAMRKGVAVIQNLAMKAAVVITALVVGMGFGIGFDDYKSINCELSFSNYCLAPQDSNTRRSF